MISNRTYGIDPDVIAYNARIVAAGNQSLNFQAIRDLNQFVISIKKMNLWASMVCWPLRANQNAGSGNIAYSLGGLGTFNGTLNGTINRVANGLKVNGFGSNITANISNAGGNVNRSSICVTTEYVSGQIVGPSWGGISPTRFSLRRDNASSAMLDTFDGTGNDGYGNTSGLTEPIFYGASYNSSNSSLFFYANGFVRNSSTLSRNFSSQTVMKMNGWDTSDGVGVGTFCFSAIFNTAISQADIQQIYSLYKSTLGQGLNLP